MTAPTTEAQALREALAFTIRASEVSHRFAGETADALLAGPLAPILAQVEDDRGWEDTLRYCERQWQDERGVMFDRITVAEADLAAARAEIEALHRVIGMALAEAEFAQADEADGSATDRTRHVRLAGIRDALTGVGDAVARSALAPEPHRESGNV